MEVNVKMVKKYEQVYTGLLDYNFSGFVSGDPHQQQEGADLWTPQGDVTIIGAQVIAKCNPLPNTALGDLGGVYCFADVSTIARHNEPRALIAKGHLILDPLEDPTVGEHNLLVPHDFHAPILFPSGFGVDVDRWHPVYLNVGFRAFFTAGGFELGASAILWYVER